MHVVGRDPTMKRHVIPSPTLTGFDRSARFTELVDSDSVTGLDLVLVMLRHEHRRKQPVLVGLAVMIKPVSEQVTFAIEF
jgi:hypothetical protein